jgi:hypothetical protein
VTDIHQKLVGSVWGFYHMLGVIHYRTGLSKDTIVSTILVIDHILVAYLAKKMWEKIAKYGF